MHEIDSEAFINRLAEYLEVFMLDIKTAPSRKHFYTYVTSASVSWTEFYTCVSWTRTAGTLLR